MKIKINACKYLFITLLLFLSCAGITPIEPCFTPGQDCAASIIQQINNAKTEVLVQAYSFTSVPIAKALLEAHKRGVSVEVILDKSNLTTKYSTNTFLKNAGIPVFIDSAHNIAHNKIMIIDREIVITGSYNFTRAAQERNAENVLIIKNTNIANQYLLNWQTHKKHSE